MGMWTIRRCRFCSSESSCISRGVSIGPGHKALQRIPRRAYSTAISRVIASTAPFEDVYAVCDVAAPTHATNDATLMIEPPPLASIAGIPYLQPNATPLTLTASVVSQIVSEVASTDPSSGAMQAAWL